MAARFLVGGAGTWDSAATTHWSAISGGASGASAPTSSDDVTFDANSGLTNVSTVTIASTAACNNLTVGSIAAVGVIFSLSSNFSPSGSVSINGNSRKEQLLFASNTPGTPRTLTIGTLSALTNCDFRDITGAGAASPFTGTAIGDCLGNSGITFTEAVTRYAVVAGNLSSTATWSATSGGAGGASVPLPQDTVFFNASSAAGTYTGDSARLGKDVDFTGFTRTFTQSGNNNTAEVFGNLTLASGMTLSGTFGFHFRGRGSQTITSNGKTLTGQTNITAPGGTYTLQDAFAMTSGGSLILTSGTLDANGKTVSLGASFQSTGSATRTLKMGGGTWTLSATGANTVWSVAASLTLVHGGSIIDITATDATAKTFAGAGLTYSTLRYKPTGTGTLTITGSNTFATLDLEDTTAKTVTLPANGTQTVTGQTTLQGAASQLLSLVSSTPGTKTTLAINCTLYTNTNTSLSSDIAVTCVINMGGAGVASGEAFGTTAVLRRLGPIGIPSGQAFGTAYVLGAIWPKGVATAEAFGTTKVLRILGMVGVNSAEAFGTTRALRIIGPTGIQTGQAIGTAYVLTAISPKGIHTAEAFGTAKLIRIVLPQGIVTAEGFGTLTVPHPDGLPARILYMVVPLATVVHDALGLGQVNAAPAVLATMTHDSLGLGNIMYTLGPVATVSHQ